MSENSSALLEETGAKVVRTACFLYIQVSEYIFNVLFRNLNRYRVEQEEDVVGAYSYH